MSTPPPPGPGAESDSTTAPPGPEEVPELAPALARFEAGDFREANRLTDALLGLHADGPVADAARTLKRRLAPDPWAVRIGIGSLALLLWLVFAYVF